MPSHLVRSTMVPRHSQQTWRWAPGGPPVLRSTTPQLQGAAGIITPSGGVHSSACRAQVFALAYRALLLMAPNQEAQSWGTRSCAVATLPQQATAMFLCSCHRPNAFPPVSSSQVLTGDEGSRFSQFRNLIEAV
ncbi:hypothetical protein NDU88_005077 [Pleurodeles waltl]|uniref:Uncharacterized protein n=1 Tax=Pleurodeles waltl TaxID=8319 RepID=A0AAV7UI54_PLEWA|nr:hypothetical protein NDU88_005077 [Pleurodeles waltl]